MVSVIEHLFMFTTVFPPGENVYLVLLLFLYGLFGVFLDVELYELCMCNEY